MPSLIETTAASEGATNHSADGVDGSISDPDVTPEGKSRDRPGRTSWIVGGLVVAILVAWALSHFDEGEAAESERTTSTTIEAGEAQPEELPTGVDDDAPSTTTTSVAPVTTAPRDSQDTGDTTNQPDEEIEPATINDELSLDPVTFEVLSATVTDEGRVVLGRAAAFLAANPDVVVEIAGHADSDGEEAENIGLSQERAESVKAHLVGEGIDESRMTAVGYGDDQPIASNDTPEGKARNRRIEFIIIE